QIVNMRLIKGVGNREMLFWTVFSIALCHLIAKLMSHFFPMHNPWHIPNSVKFADYEKRMEVLNLEMKVVFERLFDLAKDDSFALTPQEFPHFTPEVYCPYLVVLGDRKFCAPWLFQKGVRRNRFDFEKQKDENKVEETAGKEGSAVEGSSGCSFYSFHSPNSTIHTQSDSAAEKKLPKCTQNVYERLLLTSQHVDMMFVGTGLEEPISTSDIGNIASARVCQLVIDFEINSLAIKLLRELGDRKYRLMNYEMAYESSTNSVVARSSFISKTCTDHFGVKYIKKYLA
ncbi:hypothetical protein PFISCL1PPCAC_15827, partial [Pristionchus fissidentatus]